jgi:pimeloyl-ACP methyl ester carboxylesterase
VRFGHKSITPLMNLLIRLAYLNIKNNIMKFRIFKRSFLVNCFWILTLLFFGNSSYAQINYGSNNGNYITIKNVKIYYEEYGQGIPLILLHGGFGSISHFKNVIEPLSKKYRVIAMDSPGQGRSEQIDSMSYQIYANYYAEFIDNLKLDSVYVLGWSDGGNSAFILAYDRPDKVKKVIVSGANSDTDGYQDGDLEMMKRQSDPKNISDEVRTKWVPAFLSKTPNKDNWEKSYKQLYKMWVTKEVISDAHLSNIKSKFLIVYGDKDIMKLEHGLHIYKTIKGSEFCILPNTSHWVFKEKPDLITGIILNFLDK